LVVPYPKKRLPGRESSPVVQMGRLLDQLWIWISSKRPRFKKRRTLRS
jgi:hypothetical protein